MKKIVFNHTAHKALWNWLSKNPLKKKHQWPAWEWNEGRVEAVDRYCFACDYAYEVCKQLNDKRSNKCYHCPFKHPTDKYDDSDCLQEEYQLWRRFNNQCDYELALECAKIIRDWPVREDIFTK